MSCDLQRYFYRSLFKLLLNAHIGSMMPKWSGTMVREFGKPSTYPILSNIILLET